MNQNFISSFQFELFKRLTNAYILVINPSKI